MDRKYTIPWDTIDWRKTTKAIANDLGVAITTVSYQRRKHAPDTVRMRSYPRDWSLIDWSKTNAQILDETGASPSSVSNARKLWAGGSDFRHRIAVRATRSQLRAWGIKAKGVPLGEWLASLADRA